MELNSIDHCFYPYTQTTRGKNNYTLSFGALILNYINITMNEAQINYVFFLTRHALNKHRQRNFLPPVRTISSWIGDFDLFLVIICIAMNKYEAYYVLFCDEIIFILHGKIRISSH